MAGGMRALLQVGALVGVSVAGGIQPVMAADCWSSAALEPAKLRQLDVMLLVSSLRCRLGPDDFKADYDSFLEQHRPMLSQANHIILDDMTSRVGAIGALEALDRMSVGIANHYGERGSFGCRELKAVTQELARGGDEDIPMAADMLVGADVLADACPVQVAARK